jgi:hypothetical protein
MGQLFWWLIVIFAIADIDEILSVQFRAREGSHSETTIKVWPLNIIRFNKSKRRLIFEKSTATHFASHFISFILHRISIILHPISPLISVIFISLLISLNAVIACNSFRGKLALLEQNWKLKRWNFFQNLKTISRCSIYVVPSRASSFEKVIFISPSMPLTGLSLEMYIFHFEAISLSTHISGSKRPIFTILVLFERCQ